METHDLIGYLVMLFLVQIIFIIVFFRSNNKTIYKNFFISVSNKTNMMIQKNEKTRYFFFTCNFHRGKVVFHLNISLIKINKRIPLLSIKNILYFSSILALPYL